MIDMGYGGALIWTGLARNLKREHPDKKVVFLYGWSPTKNKDHVIYQNNKDIEGVWSYLIWKLKRKKYNLDDVIEVDMENPAYMYCVLRDGKYVHKTGKHAIQIACDVHGIDNAELKPRIRLTKKEFDYSERLMWNYSLTYRIINKPFICIEPDVKGILQTKAWIWERWQELVNKLSEKYTIAQIGVKGSKVLGGVVDLTGKTTFRQTANILKSSLFLISNAF